MSEPSNALPADPKWIAELRAKEAEAIATAFATLTYLLSQGRSLGSGSQEPFINFAVKIAMSGLQSISTREEFESTHRAWVQTLRESVLKPRKGADTISYGQGQKSLNVFLKFYMDYASLPDGATAARLRPWLHCPLDSVVMNKLSHEFRPLWLQRVRPHFNGAYQQRFSLSCMTEEYYTAWQELIRALSPDKPVLVDTKWAFERAIAAGQ
jgi:hypothetical protein